MFMPKGPLPEGQDKLIASLLPTIKNPACAYQLQSLQATMEEYRKTGGKPNWTNEAHMMKLVESSLEATEKVFQNCKEESAGGQIFRATMDAASLTMFGVLQANPGAWLVGAGIEIVRRLGVALQQLFVWKTAEDKAKDQVQERAREADRLREMQNKVCMYTVYMDAVSVLKDSSRKSDIVQACGYMDPGKLCEACWDLDKNLSAIRAALNGQPNEKGCAVIRAEVSGKLSPEASTVGSLFSKNRGLSSSTRQDSALIQRASVVLSRIKLLDPSAAGPFEASWKALQDSVGADKGCEGVLSAWDAFQKKLEPLLTAEEYRDYAKLRSQIENFESIANQDIEALSYSATHLLLNHQFAKLAVERSDNLKEAARSLGRQLDRLDGFNSEEECATFKQSLKAATVAAEQAESPVNMCTVLTSQRTGKGVNQEPLFGQRINPVEHSIVMVEEKGNGTKLTESCGLLDDGVNQLQKQRYRFNAFSKKARQKCGPGAALDWPRTL